MPFSFKPEIAPGAPGAEPSSVPQASFGGASTQDLLHREPGSGKSVVQLFLIAVFGSTVLIAIGMFGYSYYLSSQIEAKKATLASYESQLGNLPLEDMRKLSSRIKIINQLVKEHPSVNVAFRVIEDSIENQVTYHRFGLGYSESAKSYVLSLDGVAPDYKGVAQQVDTYKRKPYTTYIPNVTVDNLAPDQSGNVGFSLRMPITIAGLLPEDLNLSEGAAARVASSTLPESVVATTTQAIEVPLGTTTPSKP